ncbi:uncharacterized protein H6S33_000263 [Morchella sextelata]|uniref:uncharacterized protein n=1 Tax=Morchella sextelata TaxID=1174677 RepID=UPI001D04F5A4|nr:uncharacterized protein H6S33_000263 [Morchella sextelata]KAH0614627.1 hypothetical protein H6S33_000263 [Morchella sextelata]
MQLSLSSFYLWVAVFSAFSILAAADGVETNGQNPITYPLLGDLVDAGNPVTITWKPTTSGTITLHILKGPPDNLSDLGAIVVAAPNSGSYTWTVPSDYEDSSKMPVGDKYGIQIIDDLTGTYEYSPPFDMSVPAPVTSSTSKSPETTTATSQPAAETSTTLPGKDTTTPTSVFSETPTGISNAKEAKGVAGGEDPAAITSASQSTASTSSLLNSDKDLTAVPDLGLIFGAASAGVGGLIIIIVIAAVWARVRSDKKKADYYGKSFRDRRSAFDSPSTRHSRSSSSSSFGDRRASQLFNYPRLQRLLSSRTLNRGPSTRLRRGLSSRGAHHGRSSPPPPIPMMPTIKLKNPPPPLRGPLQVVNRHTMHSIPDSPPPPLTPLPIAMTRGPPEPLNLGLQTHQPYKPRVYTPIRSGFEDLPL